MKTSRDTSITNTRGRGRGRGGRADRGRETGSKAPRNTVVASSGLFSHGAGDGTTKRLFRYHANEPTTSTLRRPTLTSKRVKVDPQAEQKHIAEIYDLEMDEADDHTGSAMNDYFSPIILNQGNFTTKLFRLRHKMTIYCAFTVKSEVKLEDRINGIEIKDESAESSNTRLKYPNDLGEFLNRNTPQLFLMQVTDPDS